MEKGHLKDALFCCREFLDEQGKRQISSEHLDFSKESFSL